MKIIKLSGIAGMQYAVRHWGRWYVMLEDGGMVYAGTWFKEARKK